jgi:hypothetical protein
MAPVANNPLIVVGSLRQNRFFPPFLYCKTINEVEQRPLEKTGGTEKPDE